MSDKLFESISALMDNEVDDLELRRLLKEMETNDELARVWSRYHVARDVLHKELPVSAVTNIDLTARVRAALQEEGVHRERTFMNSLPRSAAVAAVVMFSVLLTAKLVVNQPATGGNSNNVMAAVPNVANPAIQRAGYIVGQPASASLRAQRDLRYNDVQRVEQVNMKNGYIVLPAAEVQSSNPAP
jgi:sigma-E factor negative regulatory protein RseA